MTSASPDLPPANDFLLYAAPDGAVKVRVLFKDETAWLPQKGLAELFGVGVPAINKHLKNIFESGELEPTATISKMEIVQSEGAREIARSVDVYNLDAIIAVGYRVNSYQATQFRIWATKVLREFMIKGFVLDDERLEQVRGSSARTTSTTCSSASGRSGRASGDSIRRSPISTRFPSTTTAMHRSRVNSSPPCRTSCTGPSPARPPRSSSTPPPMRPSPSWACRPGSTRRRARSSSPT